MIASIWDTCQIIFYGLIITFYELEVIGRLKRWWKKQPQIEEELALRALKEVGTKKTGFTCIVTGANSGVGLETAYYLACTGYHVIFGCRDKTSTENAIVKLNQRAAPLNINLSVEFLRVDLSDQSSIISFVEEIKKRENLKLDLIVNNVGVMWSPCGTTKEGIETHFGVNHIGHFLLTMLLLPVLRDNSRILSIGSITSRFGSIPLDDINLKKQYNRFKAYSNSKLAISHFTISLAEKLKQSEKNISVYYIDPGTANTEITKSMPKILIFLYQTVGKVIFKSPFQGACCAIYAAIAPELEGKSGLFLFECKVQPTIFRSEKMYDEERKKLWQLSEELSRIKYPY